MGDMELAEKMIIAAKSSGADMAKFQYWAPSKLKPGPWDNDGRLEIYNAAALNEDKILLLMELCSENSIEFLISAFNASDASFINNLGIKKFLHMRWQILRFINLQLIIFRRFMYHLVPEQHLRLSRPVISTTMSKGFLGLACIVFLPIRVDLRMQTFLD